MNAPKKPFPNYKWRWATLLPTESLNNPPIYLGVLRVLFANEGMPPNSLQVGDQLEIVQSETHSHVNLVRTPERNLIRNSGQYWKALGLLSDSSGEIELTDFGRRVASGGITKTEFAMTVIKTLQLPNKRIEQDVSDWEAVGLLIKPLELLIQIMHILSQNNNVTEAFVTPSELIHIVIPLAGTKAPLSQHVEALTLYRKGRLDVSNWPNCAPESNDRRMAREFLLFLANYGVCRHAKGMGAKEEKFILANPALDGLDNFERLDLSGEELSHAVRRVRESGVPANAEREKVLVEVTGRPQQRIFRNNVLAAYEETCLVTGVGMDTVLEAVHIIPVKYHGNDRIENGLCLRSDIHVLFDSGHMRIDTSGAVHLSEIAALGNNYDSVPRRISIPNFVNLDNISWRWKYY